MISPTEISIRALGGTTFEAPGYGQFEAGEINELGQWAEGDESPGEIARDMFAIPQTVAIVEAF